MNRLKLSFLHARAFLILIAVILFTTKVEAQGFPVSPVTVDMDVVELNAHSYFIIDSTFELTPSHLLTLPISAWKKGIIQGYCEYPMWAIFKVKNQSSESYPRVLYLNNAFVQEADIYWIINDSIPAQPQITGLGRSMSNKLYSDPMFPVGVQVPANAEITLLLKIYDPVSTMYAPPYILSQQKANNLKDTRLAFSYLWIGALGLSLILALFMLVNIKKKIFAQYIFLGLSTAMIIIPNIGAIFYFVDADPYQLVTNVYQFGAAFLIIFMPGFLNCIVPISKIEPRTWKLMRLASYIGVFLCCLNCIPVLKYNLSFLHFVIYYLVYSSMAIFVYLLLLLGIAAYKKASQAMALFIIYFLYLNIAFMVVLLPFFNVEIKDLNAFYFMLAGSAFETIAFLLIMAKVTLSVYRERNRLNEQVMQNQVVMMNSIVKGQEDERQRVAKDLHDGFGGMITSLNLYLKSLENEKKNDLEKRMSVYESSKKVLNEMYAELRNICFNLMPQTLISAGIGKALTEMAHRLNESNQIFISVSVFGFDDRLSQLQEISLYRITQEWINNALKYSNATKIDIQLTRDEDELTLIIEDDGLGFDKNLLLQSQGNGWKNIQSRAELIKGKVELDTRVDTRGTTFIINACLKSSQNKPKELKDLTNP